MTWELYDQLTAPLPGDWIVDEVVIGPTWTAVRSGVQVGISATGEGTFRPSPDAAGLTGRTLREVAGLVKSWNFQEAGIGLAAINAWHNRPERTREISEGDTDSFLAHAAACKGRQVAVVGGFPNLKRVFADAAELSVLERIPGMGEYPDPACEYLLPEQDYVFITGSALVNKTMPRLLELSGNAVTVLLGPSVPCAEVLFQYGADELGGFSAEKCRDICEMAQISKASIFEWGRRYRVRRG